MGTTADKIAVIGATGNTGRALVERLAGDGANIIAIARGLEKLQLLGSGVIVRSADAGEDPATLAAVLADAAIVVNAAHARYTRAIIAALPNPDTRLITLGSTRMFTRFPDKKAAEVADAQAAHTQSGVSGLILHPTMIYGGADSNICRIAAWLRWLPVVALPKRGQALLQPIHRDDVVTSVLAAIAADVGAAPLVIAGAAALPYSAIVRACGQAIGRRVIVASIPAWLMRALAPVTSVLPGLPALTRDEARRLTEDKDFDIGPMRARLGIVPMNFHEGLARMVAAGELR